MGIISGNDKISIILGIIDQITATTQTITKSLEAVTMATQSLTNVLSGVNSADLSGFSSSVGASVSTVGQEINGLNEVGAV